MTPLISAVVYHQIYRPMCDSRSPLLSEQLKNQYRFTHVDDHGQRHKAERQSMTAYGLRVLALITLDLFVFVGFESNPRFECTDMEMRSFRRKSLEGHGCLGGACLIGVLKSELQALYLSAAHHE